MTDRRRVKGMVKVIISLLVIAIIVGYGIYRAKTLAEGPKITVIEPRDGSLSAASLITVSGTAKNISFLNLNGSQIFTDEAGAFSEKILLANGYNVITLSASDRFGRKTEKSLQIMYK